MTISISHIKKPWHSFLIACLRTIEPLNDKSQTQTQTGNSRTKLPNTSVVPGLNVSLLYSMTALYTSSSKHSSQHYMTCYQFVLFYKLCDNRDFQPYFSLYSRFLPHSKYSNNIDERMDRWMDGGPRLEHKHSFSDNPAGGRRRQ